jgi:energy-converting hydrogenase A subunit R
MQKSSKMNLRVFVSDCEGPISKNDNAFELTSSFVPDGDRFFATISKYDDVLADIVKKDGYKAGDTLRLILPFLKAYDVTDKKIRDFSTNNILLVHGAKDTLSFVKAIMNSFIVSTSYEQYISALCKLTAFPFNKTYCTRLNMDKYQISTEEKDQIKKLAREIADLPIIEIPKNAFSRSEFSRVDQETVDRLDEIFWEELAGMESGKMISEVNPIGGSEKARSVKDIAKMEDCDLDHIMYIGDSITDAPALKLVRDNNGFAVSFNGNRYSVCEADIIVLSSDTIVTSVLAEVFNRLGKEGALKLVNEWNVSGLAKYCNDPELRKCMIQAFGEKFPQVEQVNSDNMERVTQESIIFRKNVRGEAIGKLG